MKKTWIVDIIVGEYWDRYAETNHEEWANEIADAKRATGFTTRVSKVTEDVELGEGKKP